MRWQPRRRLALMLLLLAGTGATARESVVIYRCTDADGALTLQNDVPCPKGARQERRVIETAAPAAPPPVAPAVEPATPELPAPAAESTLEIAAAERLPPPALFECRSYDDRRYLSQDGAPPEHCAPLQTTGVGGAAGVGAGVACEMVTDQCQPIADAALCEGWQLHLREAESALRFGRFASREAAQADVARVTEIVRASSCGG